MRIMILGSGGREHALAWAVAKSPLCAELFAAPGNPGIARVATCVPLDILSPEAVVDCATDHKIDLVIIGPEAPLAAGVSDALLHSGIQVFGPSQAAAQLEASKAFTHEICDAAGAPMAAYATFTDSEAAKAYIRAQGAPIVIKADGLAAGKGVVIAQDLAEAESAVDEMLGGRFGDASKSIVVEEFLEGEEASFFILSDGENVLSLASSQDHKRAFDNDEGPNTGGMGAYSPAPVMTPEVEEAALSTIIRPVIAEMARRGIPYRGLLYAGLMISNGVPRLIEFNVRFGDPECQALMLRLASDIVPALIACAGAGLPEVTLDWHPASAITVVMASEGYPGSYEKGAEIGGLAAAESDEAVTIFHAGTALVDHRLCAAGGRVLNVSALGPTLAEARQHAYGAIDKIDWPGGFCRKDIGWRAL